MPDYANPQNLNRYSYVANNPMRYTDPTGHMQQVDDGGGHCDDWCIDNVVNPPKPKKDHKKENNPIVSYCGSSSTLGCLANLTQDLATITDVIGVGVIETPAVAVGCVEGGPLGCAIPEVGVIATWSLTLNNIETPLSLASFGFTLLDDFVNNGGWGENSSTSLVTLAAGALPLTPSWDLIVDSYATGYNHGLFNGVNTILTDGIFK